MCSDHGGSSGCPAMCSARPHSPFLHTSQHTQHFQPLQHWRGLRPHQPGHGLETTNDTHPSRARWPKCNQLRDTFRRHVLVDNHFGNPPKRLTIRLASHVQSRLRSQCTTFPFSIPGARIRPPAPAWRPSARPPPSARRQGSALAPTGRHAPDGVDSPTLRVLAAPAALPPLGPARASRRENRRWPTYNRRLAVPCGEMGEDELRVLR